MRIGPGDPPAPAERARKGGSWKLFTGLLRTTHRYSNPSIVHQNDVGFHCARDTR